MTFNLFNTKVYVSYLFVSVLTLILFLKNSQTVLFCLLFSLCHEMGHIIFMKLLGSTLYEIRFLPFCIAIKAEDLSSLSKTRQTLVLLAGVFVNFLLLPLNFQINLALIIFNLLPIGTLDGGRILRLFFKTNTIPTIISFLILTPAFVLSIKHQNLTLFLTSLYLFFQIVVEKNF